MTKGKNARKRAYKAWKASESALVASLRTRVSKLTGPPPRSLFAPRRIKVVGRGKQVRNLDDRWRDWVRTERDGYVYEGFKFTLAEGNAMKLPDQGCTFEDGRWWYVYQK